SWCRGVAGVRATPPPDPGTRPRPDRANCCSERASRPSRSPGDTNAHRRRALDADSPGCAMPAAPRTARGTRTPPRTGSSRRISTPQRPPPPDATAFCRRMNLARKPLAFTQLLEQGDALAEEGRVAHLNQPFGGQTCEAQQQNGQNEKARKDAAQK